MQGSAKDDDDKKILSHIYQILDVVPNKINNLEFSQRENEKSGCVC